MRLELVKKADVNILVSLNLHLAGKRLQSVRYPLLQIQNLCVKNLIFACVNTENRNGSQQTPARSARRFIPACVLNSSKLICAPLYFMSAHTPANTAVQNAFCFPVVYRSFGSIVMLCCGDNICFLTRGGKGRWSHLPRGET